MSGMIRKTLYSDHLLAKQAITISTVEKWIVENDRQLNMTIWLWYDKADREHLCTEVCPLHLLPRQAL